VSGDAEISCAIQMFGRISDDYSKMLNVFEIGIIFKVLR